MKSVKLIFIAMEIAMLLGVIMFVFLTDWVEVELEGSSWMFKLMIVLLSIGAVTFQREQQELEYDKEEE